MYIIILSKYVKKIDFLKPEHETTSLMIYGINMGSVLK